MNIYKTTVTFALVLCFGHPVVAQTIFPMKPGVTYNSIGNSTYGSDGTSYNSIGNSTYGSDGSTSTTIGNTTFGSGGTSCTTIGSTTFCN